MPRVGCYGVERLRVLVVRIQGDDEDLGPGLFAQFARAQGRERRVSARRDAVREDDDDAARALTPVRRANRTTSVILQRDARLLWETIRTVLLRKIVLPLSTTFRNLL